MNLWESIKEQEPAKVWEQIASKEIKGQGVDSRLLSEQGQRCVPSTLIVGLDNSDTAMVYLQLLEQNPRQILEGMCILAYALGSKEKVLVLPETETASGMKETLLPLAETYQIKLESGLIDQRENQENRICHLAAAADLYDCLAGASECGVYVSVNGARLNKVPAHTTIRELLHQEGMGAETVNAVKGLAAGYRIYGPERLDSTIAEIKPDNGSIQVFTAADCIIRMTEERLLASRRQSCGKCVFCREGLIQLHEMHKDIAEGKGRQEYLPIMREIGEAMAVSSVCSMGQTAAEAALSAMEAFPEEYSAHNKKKCPANLCFSAKAVYIDPKTCIGCGACIDECPKDAIIGKKGYIHMIDQMDCIQCNACTAACEEGSIIETSGKLPKLPEKLTKCGKFKKH